ncbi:single-stranded-DNA-specific exonuclease RecJ [Persicobacter psychrovividus]|uniref:Single-stranded-DNA-specific exonuclease RecJ n=1 Tax=Persicobacter psychrovividus TaxID=387638 RepID=A0ABN6LAV5_9BACT|nr:single-stranded-DNA-specific exonuclease RecJ [Persicobacter psychrovividus]
MVKKWIYKSAAPQEDVDRLMAEVGVSETVASLLAQRSIRNYEEAKAFFRPSLAHLHDPFLMKGMDIAVNRLQEAFQQREKIMIYGDYDVDGTTSVALVYGFIKTLYPNVAFYVPDRYKEGYGVSTKGMEYARDNNFKLIISLDCGIKAVDRIQQAKDYGIDFIICDHHRPGEILPPAIAILDPKQQDCPYPFTELSGCGVGFKFMQGYCQRFDIPERKLFAFLDLVAVSIAADIVPVSDENRVLAHFGLKLLNKKPSHGLKALMNLGGGMNKMSISAIVFGIGPRINAAGRMAHASGAVDLLLAKDEVEAEQLAKQIESKNEIRRNFDSNITAEAIEMIESQGDDNAKSTVLFKSDWHKGVIGIVASRCIDKFYRPTIIMTESNRKATGSARSVNGFDVYEAISECAELLDQFGGHRYAAGLTMDIDKVDAFREKFNRIVAERITEDQLTPQLNVDRRIALNEVNYKLYNILKQMAPFGPENMTPIFVSENLKVVDRPRLLKGEHLKFKVTQDGNEEPIEAIGFGFGQYYDLVSSGMRFRMAYSVEENTYMGRKNLQLYVKDIKFEE